MRSRMVRRRPFLQGSAALAGLGLLTGCRMLPSQPPPVKPRRIGFLADFPDTYFSYFLEGLSERGYVESESFVVEKRFARGDYAQFPRLIAELDGEGVEAIVCGGIAACTGARQSATSTPLIAWLVAQDAVDAGLVQNLARPEGNMTGVAGVSGLQFHAKLLEILNAAIPGARRVGILAHAPLPTLTKILESLDDAASRLGLQLEVRQVQDATGIESAFTALSAAGADAVLVVISLIFIGTDVRLQIAGLSLTHRLPVASTDTALPQAGGFLAYSPNRPDTAHRTAAFVDKILKGAKPAELPMERPSTFDLIINLKTAQALGLAIPQSVLAQATELVE